MTRCIRPPCPGEWIPAQKFKLMDIHGRTAVIVCSGLQRVQPFLMVRRSGRNHDKHAAVRLPDLTDLFEPSGPVAADENCGCVGRNFIRMVLPGDLKAQMSRERHQVVSEMVGKVKQADNAHRRLHGNIRSGL